MLSSVAVIQFGRRQESCLGMARCALVLFLCAQGWGGRGNKKQEEFTLDFNICQYLTADISAAEANQRLESAKQPYQVLPTNITSECA